MGLKRNLPAIYDPKTAEQRGLKSQEEECDMKKGTLPQWINIAITILFVLGGGAWYMGKLDSKIETGFNQTRMSLDTLMDIQKANASKFNQLAGITSRLEITTALSSTQISALEKKTETIESRQYQSRKRKGR